MMSDVCFSVFFWQGPWQVETVCFGPSLWKASPRVSPWSWPHRQHAWTGQTAAHTMELLKVGFYYVMYNLSFYFEFDLYPQEETGGEVASSPPESSFQKLAPSETRYTILRRDRDELWPLQPFRDPVTQYHAPGSGRGLGLGTGHRDRTATPNNFTEEWKIERWRRAGEKQDSKRRRREEHSHDTTMLE